MARMGLNATACDTSLTSVTSRHAARSQGGAVPSFFVLFIKIYCTIINLVGYYMYFKIDLLVVSGFFF